MHIKYMIYKHFLPFCRLPFSYFFKFYFDCSFGCAEAVVLGSHTWYLLLLLVVLVIISKKSIVKAKSESCFLRFLLDILYFQVLYLNP